MGLLRSSFCLRRTCLSPSANGMSRAIGHKKLGPGRLVCYISKMKEAAHEDAFAAVWGPYPNYDDIARFDYGRKLWRQPDMRARFLRHWTDERHPYKHR